MDFTTAWPWGEIMSAISPLTRTRIRRFFRNRLATAALVLLVFLSLIGLSAPWIAPVSPHEITPLDELEPYVSVDLTLRPKSQTGRFDLLSDGQVTNVLVPQGILKSGDKLDECFSFSVEQARQIANHFQPGKHPRLLLSVQDKRLSQWHLRFLPVVSTNRHYSVLRVGVWPESCSLATVFLRFPNPSGPAWKKLSKREQQQLTAWAQHPGMTNVVWQGISTDLTVTRASVTWPFRPVPHHPLGVDSAGRDVLARILYGLRISLAFGLALALWSALFGIVIGALQGYFGGWVDVCCQRVTEIWSALPFLYVMVFVGAVVGRSFLVLLLCYGAFNWIGVSYYMRGEFLRLRQQPFVEAAVTQHLSKRRIIFRHILPNALTPIITLFPFNLVGAIASLVALDFLGFGLPPLTPSLGELLQQAQQFRWAWWLIFYPSFVIFLVMLATIMVGEGIREAFAPKARNHLE